MPSLPLRTGQQLPLPKQRSGLGLPRSGLNFSAAVLSKIKDWFNTHPTLYECWLVCFPSDQHAGGLGCQQKGSQT